jgi:hypothetical protein
MQLASDLAAARKDESKIKVRRQQIRAMKLFIGTMQFPRLNVAI